MMLLNLHPGSVIAVGVLLPALASIALALRFYSRHRLCILLREDDWIGLVACVLVWGLGITNIAGAALGALGAHSKPAGPNAPHHDTIVRGRRDEIAEQIVLGYSVVEKITFGVIKIGVILAYRRMFRGKRWFDLASLIMIIVNTLLAVAFLIVSACQCKVRNWNLKYVDWSHRRHCVQAEVSWSAFAICDVITDILLLLLPIPMVWMLQLTTSKKISVMLVFLLGSLSTAVGIVRMVVILYFTYGRASSGWSKGKPLTNDIGSGDGYRDLLDTISTALIWSLVEASVAIIASCLPSIRPLIHRASDSSARSKGMTTSREFASKRRASRLLQENLYEFDRIEDRPCLKSADEESRR
ncbi:hypothetical protein N7468_005017 [Penicillium chermesinum]|uniref:Rhodopsin domain-containing protein n=1 Tax=Penicillium chermesinum TaxID=63820 RepID=A0A9W9NYQ7_9EURO|nr:uncharacterized protein N7468_005017 [Penicillium chermesinum]KAJ5232061.1 hypothetical protein N7468_005017 [Penicillium chermesinum]